MAKLNAFENLLKTPQNKETSSYLLDFALEEGARGPIDRSPFERDLELQSCLLVRRRGKRPRRRRRWPSPTNRIHLPIVPMVPNRVLMVVCLVLVFIVCFSW